MDETLRRSMYAQLRRSRPELFANPPGAAFEILTEPGEIESAERVRAAGLAEAGRPAFMAETGVVFADPYFMVVRDAVRMAHSGGYGTYSRMFSADDSTGVVLLPRFSGGIVLVRHFRHSTRRWHLELPRGFGSPSSEPAEDARRELLEEIGVEPSELHDLGVILPDSGANGTEVRLFLAEVTDPPRAAGADEGIDAIKVVRPAELGRMIRDEEITDGFTIAAYTRALLRDLL